MVQRRSRFTLARLMTLVLLCGAALAIVRVLAGRLVFGLHDLILAAFFFWAGRTSLRAVVREHDVW